MTAGHEMEGYSRTLLGFWIYVMTDCILFSVLFTTYWVLHTPMPGLFDLTYALGETMALLASSFTCGMAMLAAHRNKTYQMGFWFLITFLLGATFVAMELTEFTHLVQEGNSWRKNGALTGFFTLVGTHGAHVSMGLLWMLILVPPALRHGLNTTYMKRLNCLRLFWHFLDVVWIFIFTLVYLMEAI